jgi:hypothetical protein
VLGFHSTRPMLAYSAASALSRGPRGVCRHQLHCLALWNWGIRGDKPASGAAEILAHMQNLPLHCIPCCMRAVGCMSHGCADEGVCLYSPTPKSKHTHLLCLCCLLCTALLLLLLLLPQVDEDGPRCPQAGSGL